jgi:hypothetical protein
MCGEGVKEVIFKSNDVVLLFPFLFQPEEREVKTITQNSCNKKSKPPTQPYSTLLFNL